MNFAPRTITLRLGLAICLALLAAMAILAEIAGPMTALVPEHEGRMAKVRQALALTGSSPDGGGRLTATSEELLEAGEALLLDLMTLAQAKEGQQDQSIVWTMQNAWTNIAMKNILNGRAEIGTEEDKADTEGADKPKEDPLKARLLLEAAFVTIRSMWIRLAAESWGLSFWQFRFVHSYKKLRVLNHVANVAVAGSLAVAGAIAYKIQRQHQSQR